MDICLWGKALGRGGEGERLYKSSPPSDGHIRERWVMSSVISHKLPGEGLTEPHEAPVRAMPRKGRREAGDTEMHKRT